MKRNWTLATGLCIFLAIAGIGCSAKEDGGQEVTVEQAEIPDNEQEENNQPKNEELSGNKEIEILDGTVKSIGDGSLVLIKTKAEEIEEGVLLAVEPAEGYETEEDLVDIGFTEDVSYELRTVKNGGINPDEDVSVKEASFSDIKEGASLTVEGYYEGSTFIAEKVVIYEFV